MPTFSATKTKEKKGGLVSKKAVEREKLILMAVLIGGSVTVLLNFFVQAYFASRAAGEADFLIATQKAGRVLALMENDEKFALELKIARDAATENLALKKRAEELSRRWAMDPAFAVTDRERRMLQMKQIAQDPNLTPDQILYKLALTACPPKSGAGVAKHKKGYSVEVAFPYTFVTNSFPELKNFLPGYYREVRKTAAGIIRDIMAEGAPFGLTDVTVRCQGVFSVKTKSGTKKEARDMFTASATTSGRDWPGMSRYEVERVWRKGRDSFPDMIKNR